MARRVKESTAGDTVPLPAWLFNFDESEWSAPLPTSDVLAETFGAARAVQVYAGGAWSDARREWCRTNGIDHRTFRAMCRERRSADV